MKNLTKIFMAVVAGMFAFSCVTDTTTEPTVELGKVKTTIDLSFEGVKTHLGDKSDNQYPLLWSAGDQIAINGYISEPLAEEFDGKASASFEIESDSELTYPRSIVYPAPAEGAGVTFPATQEYKAGNIADGVAPLYGYAEEGEAITLKHLTGILRFAVTGDATLASMTVKAESGAIAGSYDIDCATGALTAQAGKTSDQITMSFGDGLALSTEEATPLYIAVPAGDYGILVVTLHTATDKMTARIDTSAKPITAGKVREFNAIEYAADAADGDVYLIETKEDLISFASLAAGTKSAKLAGQIDMTGVEWTPIQGFVGTFDGNKAEGHYIKGLKAPLFGTVTGTIKNLKLTDVDIVVTENHYYGEKPAVYSGAIAYHIAGGSLTDCYTSGKVEVKNGVFNPAGDDVIGDYLDVCLGGMVGLVQETEVSNCENHVDLTVTSMWDNTNTAGFSSKIGAMIGMAANASKISSCVNYGSVSYEAAHAAGKAAHIGALLGGTSAEGSLTVLKDCTNHGDFNVVATATRYNTFYVGGIAGYLNAGIEELKDLTNLGCAELLGLGNSKEYRVGGIAGSINSPSDNLVNGSKDDASKGCILINSSAESANGNTYLAGITYSTNSYKISNSANYGALTIEGKTGNTYLGGIMATIVCGEIYKCDNYGHIHHNTTATVASYTGGILAQAYVAESSTTETPLVVEGCNNYGPVCYTAASGASNTGNRIMGGLVGYGNAKNNLIPYVIKDCTSSGTMVFIDQSGSTKEIAYGGAFAYPQYGKEVTLTNVKVSAKMYFGSNVDLKTGVATPIKDHTEAAKFKMAGMCAMFTKHTTATNCDFSGLMQVDSKFTINDSIHIGGYGGYGAGRYDVINSTFSGTINYSENCSHSGGFVDISGFLGYAAHSEATMVQTFTNSGVTKSGVIRVAGDVTNAKVLYVSGIIATTSSKNTQVAMNGCYNLGTITLTKDVETTGNVYVGGIYSVRTSTSTSSNCTLTGCYNEGDIVVDAKSVATMCIGGICAYTTMLNATSSETYPKFYNKGNIKVGTNLTDGEKANYTTQLAVGGFLGLMNNNVKKNFDADFQNQGNITIKNVTTPLCNVGGVWGLHTKAPAIKSGVVLTNTGNIAVEGCSLTTAYVGGIAANTLVPISGAKVYCDLSAIGVTNFGMITGAARTDTTLATKCQVGGRIATTTSKENDVIDINPETMQPIYGIVEKPVWNTLVDKTVETLEDKQLYFYNHIYGGTTDWTGVENYDGCTYWTGPTE